jgi:hypothetical protein
MPNGIEKKAIFNYVTKLKPNVIVEFGTGKSATSGLEFCKALLHNKKGKLITYELGKEYFDSAKKILNDYVTKKIVEMNLEDSLKFFDRKIIADMYFLDAGDEKLVNSAWVVPGKDYGEGSFFQKKESENLFHFKKIESDFSKTGTYVLCHDWTFGRGTYIKKYLEGNKYDKWVLVEVVDRLAVLKRK